MKRVIAFHPELVSLLGDIDVAVFYGQLHYWKDKGDDPEGWIHKTILEFEDETSLSRKKQAKAIKVLLDKQWIQYKVKKIKGVPTRHFRPLIDLKLEIGFVQKVQMEMSQTDISDMSQTDISSITKITTEITSILSDSFEEAWESYPKERRNGKLKCESYFKRVDKNKTLTIEEIIRRLNMIKAWVKYWKESETPVRYIPLSTTFFNEERWDMEVTGELKNKNNNKVVKL